MKTPSEVFSLTHNGVAVFVGFENTVFERVFNGVCFARVFDVLKSIEDKREKTRNRATVTHPYQAYKSFQILSCHTLLQILIDILTPNAAVSHCQCRDTAV